MVEEFLVTKVDASLLTERSSLRAVFVGAEDASCLAAKDEETTALEMSGVTITSDILWLCSFAGATDAKRAAQGERRPVVPAFEDVEGVGLSGPVFLASTGKPMLKTKTQIL